MEDLFNDKDQDKLSSQNGDDLQADVEVHIGREDSESERVKNSPVGADKFILNMAQDELPNEIIMDTSKPHKVKKTRKKHGCLSTIIWALIIIAISGLASVFIITAALDITGLAKPDSEILVTIPKGSSTMEIANILNENGIIENPYAFRVYSKLKQADGMYQYGTFTMNTNMAYSQLIETMQEFATFGDTISVTFPEGYTIKQMAELLEQKGVCTADVFIETLNSTSFGYIFETSLPVNENRYYKYEGYLFPETYSFYENDDPLSVTKKIIAEFNSQFTNELRARAGELGMSLDKILILASIIQAEASDSENMKLVSSVFYNRLNDEAFAKLQSDPTRLYATQALAGIMEEETALSLYDTYICDGLPVGPVCNPGLDAITAALYPEESEYYYFCSNLSTGKFYYAKTLEEHNANLVKAGLA